MVTDSWYKTCAKTTEWHSQSAWSSLPSARNSPEPFHQPKPGLRWRCSHFPLCYVHAAWGWLVQNPRFCLGFWPSCPSLPGLPLLIFFPWEMLHSAAAGQQTLCPGHMRRCNIPLLYEKSLRWEQVLGVGKLIKQNKSVINWGKP